MAKAGALLSGLVLGTLFLAACDGGAEPQPSPSPAVERPSPTPEPTPTAEIEKPDPQTLVEAGYVLDQALEVSLDGSDAGQIVVISHTVYGVASTGDPTAATVPPAEGCPTGQAEFQSTACIFRAEVFTYDPASGWTRVFVTPPPRAPLKPGEKGATYGHRGGIQEVPQATKFRVNSKREALVLAFHYCTGVGSGCGAYHEVLTMIDREVKLVGGGWQALLTVEATSVTISNPAYFGDDPFCCPSARRSEIIALDPTTGELGVIATELVACKEGELVGVPEPPQRNTVELRGCGSFEVSDQTVVEPASIGGIQGLRAGDTVRVEYGVGECPEDGIPHNCSWGEVLAATKITVLNR